MAVNLTNGNNHIVIALKSGRAIHFREDQVRPMGRTATGVRGITLAGDDDKVVSMVCVERDDANLLVVSKKGYGKRSRAEEYRITHRGGKGVKSMNITEKTGELVAMKEVVDSDELMIINRSGITIRMAVHELRVMGRATQGVRLIKLNESDEISSVAVIKNLATDEESEQEEGNAENTEKEKNDD